MAWSDLRHWAQTLSLPRKMLFVICEHFQLFHHVMKIHESVDFLFVWRFYFIDGHSFPLSEYELELFMAILVLFHRQGFCFQEGERGIITWGVAAGPKQGAKVHVCCVSCWKADFSYSVVFKLKVEFLFRKGDCFAVGKAFAGFWEINWNCFIVCVCFWPLVTAELL